MLGALSFLPWLSTVLFDNNQLEYTQILDNHQQTALTRKVIDRIWRSLEIKVGTSHSAPLFQTAVDEIGNLLHLDRCSFLWYFPHRQRWQVVCEQVRGNQKSLQWEYDNLGMLGGALNVLVQGQAIASCDRYPTSGVWDAIKRLLSRLLFQSQKRQLSQRQTGIFCNLQIYKDFGHLLVPLSCSSSDSKLSSENKIGLIVCLRDGSRQWLPSEIESVQLVGQQLEIAMRQSELYDQSQKQAQREKLINQITSQTRLSFDLETILTSAIGQILDALVVDRCLVHLVEENRERNHQGSKGEAGISLNQSDEFWDIAHRAAYRRQHLYEVCRSPFEASIDDFDTQGPITQWVIQNRQTVVINDIIEDPRIGAQNEEYQKACIKSSLVVPVQANNVLHAILYLNQCSHTRYWSKSDRELAEVVADQLAISIQQACLFAQTRASMERESLLRLISNQIRSTLDLKNILQTAVREVRTLLNTDRAAIYQFTEDLQGEVVVEEATGDWISICEQINQNSCLLNKYAYPYQGEKVQAINDVLNANLTDKYAVFLQQLQVRASLVVPITRKEDPADSANKKLAENGSKNYSENALSVWGLLIVHECEKPRVWEKSEVELLQQLATQVAIAIQQAELYEHARTCATTAQTKAEALEKAIYDLQQAQAQLIQTEKMSSLGQLVAGVAHEINNPVNFIYGNLTYANKYAQDLLKLVNLYQKSYPEPVSEIQACADDIDLEFLLEDMPKILTSMEVGADRIRQIVLSLRNFSRLDQADMKPVNIHEGIDNTLLILQNRLKANAGRPPIQVIKEYGDLPMVECYAGQLNQVFMNLLGNAIDAVEEGYNAWRLTQGEEFSLSNIPSAIYPKIKIHTEFVSPDSIIIRIADNGPGITPEVRTRLFDAFFTTKPVGRGTGLGLSISYQIVVEKHGGVLWCESEPGKGAEFGIEIPVRQEASTSLGLK